MNTSATLVRQYSIPVLNPSDWLVHDGLIYDPGDRKKYIKEYFHEIYTEFSNLLDRMEHHPLSKEDEDYLERTLSMLIDVKKLLDEETE